MEKKLAEYRASKKQLLRQQVDQDSLNSGGRASPNRNSSGRYRFFPRLFGRNSFSTPSQGDLPESSSRSSASRWRPEEGDDEDDELLDEDQVTLADEEEEAGQSPLNSAAYERRLAYASTGLKLFLWLVLLLLAVELEVGAIYFILSVFYAIATNLGGSGETKRGVRSSGGGVRKRREQLSAYSVFNPNFETLDGTLTAEQFESEIRVLFFAKARELVTSTEQPLRLETEEDHGRWTARGLKLQLLSSFPALSPLEGHFVLAVNQEYVEGDQMLALKEGDEVAVIPPLSGG